MSVCHIFDKHTHTHGRSLVLHTDMRFSRPCARTRELHASSPALAQQQQKQQHTLSTTTTPRARPLSAPRSAHARHSYVAVGCTMFRCTSDRSIRACAPYALSIGGRGAESRVEPRGARRTGPDPQPGHLGGMDIRNGGGVRVRVGLLLVHMHTQRTHTHTHIQIRLRTYEIRIV